MSQARNIGIGAGLFVLATVALVALLYQPTDPGEVELDIDPAPEVAAPGPVPAAVPRPKPRPRPEPEPEPDPEPAPVAEPVPPDVRTEYNYAMRDAVKEARVQCVEPYVADANLPQPATVIMDAVVTDGEVTDIAMRGIGDIPDDVIECARDAAWNVDWPTWEGEGELRFQETFTVANR